MRARVEVCGVYQFPAPIGVTQGCLGKTVTIEINGHRGKATLPVLVWSDDAEPEPSITLPNMEEAYACVITRRLESTKPSPLWDVAGKVTGWSPAKRIANELRISALFLRFRLPADDIALPDEAHGRTSYRAKIPDYVRGGFDPWFSRLRLWLEAAVDQDTDPDNPIMPSSRGQLSLYFNDEGTVADLASWGPMTVTRHDFELLNLHRLRRAVTQANAETLPSDAHLLMRDARAALRRQRTRIAVIDAGTAVELTLAAFNDKGPKLSSLRGQPTLGRYVKELSARARLPADTKTALVDVRNDAAHRNRQPVRPEALRALAIAKEIVEKLDPLPV